MTVRPPLPARILIPVANPMTAEELIRLGAAMLDQRAGEQAEQRNWQQLRGEDQPDAERSLPELACRGPRKGQPGDHRPEDRHALTDHEDAQIAMTPCDRNR